MEEDRTLSAIKAAARLRRPRTIRSMQKKASSTELPDLNVREQLQPEIQHQAEGARAQGQGQQDGQQDGQQREQQAERLEQQDVQPVKRKKHRPRVVSQSKPKAENKSSPPKPKAEKKSTPPKPKQQQEHGGNEPRPRKRRKQEVFLSSPFGSERVTFTEVTAFTEVSAEMTRATAQCLRNRMDQLEVGQQQQQQQRRTYGSQALDSPQQQRDGQQQRQRHQRQRDGQQHWIEGQELAQQRLFDDVHSLIRALQRLEIRDDSQSMVPYATAGPLISVDLKKKKQKPRAKVMLDAETNRVWKALEANHEESDETTKNWDKERLEMAGKVAGFVQKMRMIQGNRQFVKWESSVVDSIIGVFLTQNVSDHLSSSAFMGLVSRFPVETNVTRPETTAPSPCSHDGCCSKPTPQDIIHLTEEEETFMEGRQKVRRALFSGDAKELHGVQPALSTGTSTEQLSVAVQSATLPQHGDDSSSSSNSSSLVQASNETDALLLKTQTERAPKQGSKRHRNSVTGDERVLLEQTRGTSQKSYDWQGIKSKVIHRGVNGSKPPDSVDWEAVRQAGAKEVANVIKDRGMNNVLAGRIQVFLDRVHEEHGSIDLEWLRDVPPQDAKEFLLSIRGLGLKSVECIRLLELDHPAFPVDTNVGRILVRLGWVPIHPLPELIQHHLLELYPVQEQIQKYIWPRLCTLDRLTLYELHYQMITFGKVFCTKTKPNCNACPMKIECKHFASAYASAKLALPAPGQEVPYNNPQQGLLPLPLPVEAQAMPTKACEPIVEEPGSPRSELCEDSLCPDMEDLFSVEENGTLHLNLIEGDTSKERQYTVASASRELMLLPPEFAYIPVPKLKNIFRLRTVHYVYELPDDHPVVQQLDPRQKKDPCFYLLALWTEENVQDQNVQNQNDHVKATLLIPCRTAMRGSFPLNGTYFQVNEVFADMETSMQPLHVPRNLLWNLRRKFVYFGTSVPAIFRGLTVEEVQACFWKGYVCVRGFDRKSRAPKPLAARLHIAPSHKRDRLKSDDE